MNKLDFDVNNHKELSPYIYFTDPSISTATKKSYDTSNVHSSLHDPFFDQVIRKIEKKIYSQKYYEEDPYHIQNYENSFLGLLGNSISFNSQSSIEQEFSHLPGITQIQEKKLKMLSELITKKITEEIIQMPISTSHFPHFNQSKATKLSEEKLTDILSQTQKNDNNNDENDFSENSKYMFSHKDLNQFYEILSQHQQAFSFSPTFFVSAINKLDIFSNSLLTSTKPNLNSNDNSSSNHKLINFLQLYDSETDKEKLIYYRLVLLIKLRLYAIMQKMHDFLQSLLELIIIDQKNPEFKKDDQNSFKRIINELLPKTQKRSTIVQNISYNKILDFSFSHDGTNDYILTNEGIFKFNHIEPDDNFYDFNDSIFTKIEFDPENNAKIHEILKNSDKTNAKIAFCDGILYLLCQKEKTIFRIRVSPPDEEVQKEFKLQQKAKNKEKYLEENQKKKKEKITPKKLREKERKQKKQKRREERNEKEEFEENLECIKFDIPDYPIISIGAYNNYIRIAQKKGDDTKLTLIFTNIDISPNSSKNFDIFETFERSIEKVSPFEQNQFELELKDTDYPQLIDACFYKNEMLLLNNDSTFDQMTIFENDKPQFSKLVQSPYQFTEDFPVKIDNHQFLHLIIPINSTENNSIAIYKISMKNTKYFLREENSIFLKYPFLRNISNLVDNCSNMIMNREVTKPYTTEEYHNDANLKGFYHENLEKEEEDFCFVSPEEMSFIIQSPKSIQPQLNNIKSLIENLEDSELKKFFIILFIKLTGINLLYSTSSYYITNEPISDASLEMFVDFTKYITAIFSLFEIPGSLILRLMLLESIVFTFSLSGKFLLDWNGFDAFFLLFRRIFLYDDESSQFYVLDIIYLLSFLMFSYPSSLYIIQKSNCDLLFEIEIDRSKLFPMFLNSIKFIPIELRYSKMVWNDGFIKFIFEYIESLFKYIRYLLEDEDSPLSMVEQLLSYLFSFNIDNISYSLKLEELLIGISKPLFERIKEFPGIIESDEEYSKIRDIQEQTVHKQIKVIESEHPYNSKPIHENCIQELGTIDFGPEIGTIYVIFDDRFDLLNDEKLILIANDETRELERTSFFNYKAPLVFYSQKIKVQLQKSVKESSTKASYWGYKLTFIGVSFDNPYYWHPNIHLYFYNYFISFLVKVHSVAFKSTELNDNEIEFNLILNDKIIQGIKLEDIDNYEEGLNEDNNNSLKPLRKALSKGISRGINYDIENIESYNDQFKKDFLKELIKENNKNNNSESSLGKEFLNILYDKTTKLNRNRIKMNHPEIIQCEHYLAACLLKHLGLINECINFTTKVNGIINSGDEQLYKQIQVPNRLQSIWKLIYLLRKTMFFEYQKSKSIQNTDSNSNQSNNKFDEYSLEIKRKCKLLLYSDPILKLMKKAVNENDSIESSAKIIYSFVTSKKPLSDISSLIDIRRERLTYSQKSIALLLKFVNENLFFESSKTNFAFFYNQIIPMRSCKGVKQSELDEYMKLFGNLSYSIINNVFSNPSASLISNARFLEKCVRYNKDDETRLKSSEIFINVLENNKNNESFVHDKVNFQMILLLLYIASRNKNSDLVDYLIPLLSSEEIDLQSKQLILIVIPVLINLIPENEKLNDESFAFSILYNNSNKPIIVKSTFYWLASLITKNHSSFIRKVLKGIGQSFTGKSCLFIDNSFQPFTHRQVSEGMISFIRILANFKNETLLEIVHDILTNHINKIKFNENDDELMTSIGLFACFGQTLSAFEPERKISSEINEPSIFNIIGYNTSSKRLRRSNNANKRITGSFYNSVLFDQQKLDLNETEIENILNLHEVISHSKYFNGKQNYENEISEKEICENVLIASFYSFLPVIFQNEKNASCLMNNKNLNRTLSLFDFSMNFIPSNENSILLLSNYLEQAITSPLYNTEPKININRVDLNGYFRFMKMDFGEIIYNNDQNDIIHTDNDRLCTFIGTRPFDFRCETFYEMKIRKIGKKQAFFGFVDCEDRKETKIYGFGYNDKKTFRCDPSTKGSSKFLFTNNISDTLASSSIQEGDLIGCYCTPEFVYMTINRRLSQFRISHKSFNSYVPIITVDHDEEEIEMTENITIVDFSTNQFNFLKIEGYPNNYFRGLNSIIGYFCKSVFAPFNEKRHYIGQQIYLSKTISTESKAKMETIDIFPSSLFHYKERYGIIKEILPINDKSRFVTKLKIESYNNYTLSKDLIDVDVDSRYIKAIKTNFFNLIENRTQTKFGFNSSFDLKEYPIKLRNSNDFRSISKFIKNKTIKDNSKSIAIIMTRYLVFILVDFLRFSKSSFLQDEKINSIEAHKIIKALAFSLPTISEFQPKFDTTIKNDEINDYIIFADKEESENDEDQNHQPIKYEYYKTPGFPKLFGRSFKSFLKKSENFISAQFIPFLLRFSFEVAFSNHSTLSSDFLYSNLLNKEKLESNSPLQKNFDRISIRPRMKNLIQLRMNGHIPLLLENIPESFPCATTDEKNIRTSSDQFSIFIRKVDRYSLFHWNWNYDERKIKKRNGSFDINSYKDYRFKLGLFYILKNMQEFLLNSSLGFIQNVFTIIQSFNDSETLSQKSKEFFSKEFVNLLFKLASKKDPIAFPFLQMIFLSISSKGGFSDSLIKSNAEGAARIFSGISNKLYEITSFPNKDNEPLLLFSIYSNLIRSRIIELKKKDNKATQLFDEYSSINSKLFKIVDNKMSKEDLEFIEGDLPKETENFMWNNSGNKRNKSKKKKNFRSFYLVYYYSILLNNESNFQYPKFLFVNDWLRQYFGCFKKIISFDDIKDFHSNSNIRYKSEILENDSDLICSCKFLSIISKDDNKDSPSGRKGSNKSDDSRNNREINCKVFIHQLKNNEKIELPKSGRNVLVSFPLEIIIVHDSGKRKKEMIEGDYFALTFRSPNERQFFIDNYEQIDKDFQQFIALSKYDNELSAKSLLMKETKPTNTNTRNNNTNNEANTRSTNNNNNNNNDDDDTEINHTENRRNFNRSVIINNGVDGDDEGDDENDLFEEDEDEINFRSEYKKYQLEKIPKSPSFSLPSLKQTGIADNVISLRLSALSTYRRLIEELILDYSLDSCSDSRSLYLQQILRPAHSMTTSSKFKFIEKILSSEGIGQTDLTVTFNRFEQQKFMDDLSKNSESIKARPLLVQFMEQIGQDALHLLKVRGSKPFNAELVGEGSIDAGGPAREIFSGLIMEMMDERIGFFTANPNRRNKLKETNAEDLIPCPMNGLSGNEVGLMFPNRFAYAGALVAVCVVSGLPQQMKLAPIVWDFLATGQVSIESVYATDQNFSQLISNAEKILKRIGDKKGNSEQVENIRSKNEEMNNEDISNTNNNDENKQIINNENGEIKNEAVNNTIENSPSISDDNIENEFCHFFTVTDSFGNESDLIQGGSKISVTASNLSEFVSLSKHFRVHEFDSQLRDMKDGFDSVMVYRSVTEMLKPSELRLLACGEPSCSVEQLKKLTKFKISKLFEDDSCIEKLIATFWKVIESFSINERLQFVRFASGNLGLPAPGLRWEDDITVVFLSQYEKENEGKNMVFAHTCISSVEIPFFQSDEELEKMLKVSIKFSGLITDSHEDIQTVVEYL